MCAGLTKEWLNSCRAWLTALQDAYNSLLVMERLRDIAVKQHKTVVDHILSPVASLLTRYCASLQIICSMHNPRFTISKMIDRVMFLSQGEVAYFGNNTGLWICGSYDKLCSRVCTLVLQM